MPVLSEHFDTHGVDPSLFSLNWFLCLFVDTLPVNTYLHIWDAFLFEGSKVLKNLANGCKSFYLLRFCFVMPLQFWNLSRRSCWGRMITCHCSAPSRQRWRASVMSRASPRSHVLRFEQDLSLIISITDRISSSQSFPAKSHQQQERSPPETYQGG